MAQGRARRSLAALAAVVLIAAGCNGLNVDQRGVYTAQPTTTITGDVTVAGGQTLVSLTVNSVDAAVEGKRWSADVPLDGEAIFNAVDVVATYSSGEVRRERRTVVYGDGDHAEVLPEGATLSDAVGLRVNERSFSKLGPVVKSLTTFDPSAVAPPGTVFLDECITQVIFCVVHARAATGGAASIQDFSVALDANQGNVRAVVTLSGMHVPVAVNAQVFGAPVNCTMNVDAASITIDGNYALQPDVVDPHFLDVNLVGATPVVTLGGVESDFVGGVCSIPGIEQIVGLFLPDVEQMMRASLTTLLGDADGPGPVDAPVAEAVEGALSQLNIAGDIGSALGLQLDSTLQSADEDPAGIGLRATASFTSDGVAFSAPDLPGSVGFPGDALGALPSTTPGGAPFDVAVGASATGFNQLLAGETERGLLNVDITSIAGVPLTLKALLDLVGAGGAVTEDRPMVIQLRPEVAPIVTQEDGPGGRPRRDVAPRVPGHHLHDRRCQGLARAGARLPHGRRHGDDRRRPGPHIRHASRGRPGPHRHEEPQQHPAGAHRRRLCPAHPAGVRGRAGRFARLPTARVRRAGPGAGRDQPGRLGLRPVRRPGAGRLKRPPPPEARSNDVPGLGAGRVRQARRRP